MHIKSAFQFLGSVCLYWCNAFSTVKIIMDKISKRSKGYAFIEYTTEEAASTALKEMNGKVSSLASPPFLFSYIYLYVHIYFFHMNLPCISRV